MNNISEEVKYIPVEKIKPNPYQPRKNFSKRALEELSQSIQSYGIIQPISVRKIGEESYELVAGERRLRAAKLASLEEVPTIIVNMRDQDSAVLAIIENLQREDLNFIEEAEGYSNLINDHGFTQHELAKKIGKNQSTVANKLRILRLPDEIKKLLIENNLSERHARALLKLPDADLQMAILEKIINNELTVKKTEKLIKDMLEDITKEDEPQRKQSIKSMINFRIYLNTIKNAYTAIKESGIDAKYEQKDMGDFIQVSVKIPKK
ncbi:nucleoid occlusion protein [Sporosalibacterium faouarense]|uniref:nucleoid occlusion protein n=1 Tax=Sporosalibacterium faouarense TaxID=516123 RepID=UPI00141D3B10|nr:nucleoid occlusion protein [Sporosalibacterium faouarense]MTI49796.1 nucleoid occlusion protein [Bacillota bacterium]